MPPKLPAHKPGVGGGMDPGGSAATIEKENEEFLTKAGKATPKSAPSGGGSKSPERSSPAPGSANGKEHPYYQEFSSSAKNIPGNIKEVVTSTQANRIVFLTVGGSMGIAALALLNKKNTSTVTQSILGGLNAPGAITNPAGGAAIVKSGPPTLLRIGIGGTVTIIILSVFAEIQPQIATQIGWLILLGTLLVKGPLAFEVVSQGLNLNKETIKKASKKHS
jgi:hypothetical protein